MKKKRPHQESCCLATSGVTWVSGKCQPPWYQTKWRWLSTELDQGSCSHNWL